MLPSAYVINPKLVPEVNADLLQSVEATSTTPLTIQYVINPKAVWSDGVPVDRRRLRLRLAVPAGRRHRRRRQPDQVASTLGYRDVATVTGSHGGRTVTVVFAKPFADWRVLFDHMVPAHIARKVGWNTGFDHFDPAVDLSAGPLLLSRCRRRTRPCWSGTRPGGGRRRSSRRWPCPSGRPRQLDRCPGDHQQGGVPAGAVHPVVAGLGQLPAQRAELVHPSLDFLSLEFDVKSTVGSHVAARQAIAHAIDRTPC